MKLKIFFLGILVFQIVAQDVADDDYIEDPDETIESPDDPLMEIPKDFDEFKNFFNKTYTPEEQAAAKEVFEENLKEVEDNNKLFKNGEVSYQIGLHEFSDIQSNDLPKMRNGRVPAPEPSDSVDDTDLTITRSARAALPTYFSWVAKGKVTRIKNQGMCGSCYAFSTAAAIESQLLIHRNKRINLSPQQTVDCSKRFGNAGCNGGLETNVFRYIKSAGGLDPWRKYPYRGNAGTCRVKPGRVGAISGYRHFSNIGADSLKQMLVNRGPICVGMDASLRSFNNYKSGVYDDPSCKKSYYSLDHAVLLVGFGTEDGKDYWLVRNSWGRSWGLNGYFKVAIKNNVCGIRTDVSYPILRKP